jgi:hypothetical protein
VRPGCEMSTHYFSCLVGPDAVSIKYGSKHYAEFLFLHTVGSVGHIVLSGASRLRNLDTVFFVLRWVQRSFHKKRVGRCCTKLVFLHLVGSAGHIVHLGSSGL